MKAIAKALPAGVAAALFWGICGCVTVPAAPRNDYDRQEDSARLANSMAPLAGITIAVQRIDGFALGAAPECFLSPGNHGITLDAWMTDDDYVFWDWEGPLQAEFSANHSYRFTGSNTGLMFDISLWDETSGAGNRVLARDWKVAAHEEVEHGEAIVDVDIGGAGIARPPLERGGHPTHPGEPTTHPGGPTTHPGGPPSIPHNPRPSPNGGGGGRGGGGGSGGGGGHSSSGGGHKK